MGLRKGRVVRSLNFFDSRGGRDLGQFLDTFILNKWYLLTVLNYLNMSKINLSNIITENSQISMAQSMPAKKPPRCAEPR